MHLLLTDRLTCPRCGPAFGLILLANRLEDRLVLDGVLGCPNCRDSFPVTDGFGDLRAPPRRDLPPGHAGLARDTSDGHGERLVALLGVVAGGGAMALVGEPARHALALTRALEEIQVVAIDPDARAWAEEPRVNRIAAGPGLPFFDGQMRALALDGRLGPEWLDEAARVVSARGRVVVTRAPESARSRLLDLGLTVLASEAETIVAARG